ncbi:Rad17-domain-containing protein, partial [Ramicandelaber brevisporus]
MWADLYPPKSKDILAVHPQKVQQVRSWLFRPPFQKYQQVQQQRGLLVLTGPSGCGKTATVRMLSNELKFEIVEWINPARSTVFESEMWVQGRAAQFSEFLRQAVRFPSLALTGTMAATSSERRSPRTVILIEDLPSVATPHAKQAFQDAISNYITLPRHQTFPVVLIVTDTFSRTPIDDEQLGTGGSYSSNGNFNGNGAAVENVRGLLPSSLIDSAMCKRISFNPIAQTYLVKGLKLFVEQIRTDTSEVGQIHAKGNYRWPSNDQISEIALVSNGDIRSALNNLQLIAELSSPSPINDRRQSLTQAQRKAMFGDDIPKWSQSAIDTREPIFDLFHSIGKILYNKRRSISSDD